MAVHEAQREFVRTPECFGGDAGAISAVARAHDAFAARNPDAIGDNLARKAGAAQRCLNGRQASNFFADASVLIASAADGGKR